MQKKITQQPEQLLKMVYAFITWSCNHEGDFPRQFHSIPLGKHLLHTAVSGLNPFGLTHRIK